MSHWGADRPYNVHMSIELLVAAQKPPDNPVDPGSAAQWLQVERSIGTSLPEDYKQYIARYGTGSFSRVDFTFLFPFNPFSGDENLVTIQESILWVYEECRVDSPEICIFNAFPEEKGLLPWGRTDNGDSLFWLTDGPPNAWDTVVFDSKYWGYERYNLTMTQFLTQWLTGDIKVNCFPSFDPGEIIFIPYSTRKPE